MTSTSLLSPLPASGDYVLLRFSESVLDSTLSELLLHLPVCVWLTLLDIMSSSFTQVVLKGGFLFFKG